MLIGIFHVLHLTLVLPFLDPLIYQHIILMVLYRKIPRHLLYLHVVAARALLDYFILLIKDFFAVHVVLRVRMIIIDLVIIIVLSHGVIMLGVLSLVCSL